jgi:hypothetical protein
MLGACTHPAVEVGMGIMAHSTPTMRTATCPAAPMPKSFFPSLLFFFGRVSFLVKKRSYHIMYKNTYKKTT